MMNKAFWFLLFQMLTNDTFSQSKTDSVTNWTAHFQSTIVYQHQSSFKAKYSGPNSLDTSSNEAYSQTSTLFIGRRLWKGAVFYFNPEITGGEGVGHVLGLAGAPNGEIYRVGNPKPSLFVARGYLQQDFPLRNTKYEYQKDDLNQLADFVPTSRITVTIGKFGIADFFDDNSYNHDARSQFLNWSLMAHGSWDFPADLRGYTTGFLVELIKPNWALRFSAVRVPRQANGAIMDWNIGKGNSETLEFERKWKVNKHPGAIRATSYVTFSKAPVYKKATEDLLKGDSTRYNVLNSTMEWNNYEGVKYGFGVNAEQEIADNIGLFTRLNWSDGRSGDWAFTEIDRNMQLGINLDGSLWKRADDVFGMAVAVNGLSPDHRDYLKAGGIGFIIGDGKLNYGTENIIEAYYRAKINSFLNLSFDYQFITNPGYNKDRKGPVHIPGVRLHIQL
jgi:high affinity Mn2+ porin